jgi:hypothetical protein
MDKKLPESSDYIVFVDESGSPTLSPMDPHYPIFVLLFFIVRKDAYAESILPAITKLKFEFFGHDLTNLHSWDIRRAKGDFRILQNPARRVQFLSELSALLTEAEFLAIAHIVDKRLIQPSHWLLSSYQVGFSLGLARVAHLLDQMEDSNKLVHVVAEARGHAENRELADHFRWISQDHAMDGDPRFQLKIVPKAINAAGLQLADLCAYPIGRYYLHPDRQNRAFEAIKGKISIARFP